MLQYIVIIFIWSVSSIFTRVACFNILDFNFCIFLLATLIDCLSHTRKAYRTLRAEYGMLTGVAQSTDTFLYCWSFIHFSKNLSVWVALGLLVHVSPVACAHSPILACVLLLYALFIKEYSNSVRKWWISKHYDVLVTIPENEI